jgi:hypothetical protein
MAGVKILHQNVSSLRVGYINYINNLISGIGVVNAFSRREYELK